MVECVQQPGDENTELGHMLKGGTNEDWHLLIICYLDELVY